MFEMILLTLLVTPWFYYTCAIHRPKVLLSPIIFLPGLLSAILTALTVLYQQTVRVSPLAPLLGDTTLLNPGLYLDSLAGLLTTTILVIGGAIVRYSIRYLEDDYKLANFQKYLAASLCSILLMVLSENFLFLIGGWISASLFLHKLLTHYKDREAAKRAATKKFIVSRLGDCFLVTAAIITYSMSGTLNIPDVLMFLTAENPLIQNSYAPSIIAALLVLAAVIKSAQVPFHSWLPDTIEAPTPVSAFMHAGIVNAGGYLILRMSPLLSKHPEILSLLIIFGVSTVAFATIIMITQSSVKRNLAYSTIGQMGFMMVECGLGAFSIALIHLIGHAFFKAYAFLASGSAAELVKLSSIASIHAPKDPGEVSDIGRYATSLLIALGILLVCTGAFELTLYKKAGSFVLIPILMFASFQLLLRSPSKHIALTYSFTLTGLYCAFYLSATSFLAPGVIDRTPSYTFYEIAIQFFALCVLLSVALLQLFKDRIKTVPWGKKLYVAALNEFYMTRY